jgi:hypothetical protein
MELKYTFSFKSVRTFGGKDLVNSSPSEYTIETIKEMVSAGVKAALPFVRNTLTGRQRTGQLYQSVYTTQSKRFKNGYIGAWINYTCVIVYYFTVIAQRLFYLVFMSHTDIFRQCIYKTFL